MIEEELFEAMWTGQRSGFSEAKIRESLAYNQAMLADLNAGKIRPARVIGTGYRGNTRKLATDYLVQAIACDERDLETRGRSNDTNQANVRYNLAKAGV